MEGEIAEKLKFYRKIRTLKTQFQQTKRIPDLDVEIKSEGEMELVRPEKVTWKVKKPAPTELILDGNKVEITSGEGREKKTESFSLDGALDASTMRSLVSMLAWLKLDIPSIQNGYTIYAVDKATFKCVPKDEKNSVFQSLTFFLHSEGHLKKLAIGEKSGDQIEIQFSKPQVTFHP